MSSSSSSSSHMPAWLAAVLVAALALTCVTDITRVHAAPLTFTPPGGGSAASTIADDGTFESVEYLGLGDKISITDGTGTVTLEEMWAKVKALEALLASASLENSGDDLVFTGVNVHIRNGEGSTATRNGGGNLIVGYNEAAASVNHTGSHNIVVGSENNYQSYGGLVAGFQNTIEAPFASVLGGEENDASGRESAVLGGYQSVASGGRSTVSGGVRSKAVGEFSSVSAGVYNTASGRASSVSGGAQNTAKGFRASIQGGFKNDAEYKYSSISGGYKNVATGVASSILGGFENTASGSQSSISGGQNGIASGTYSSVSGGSANVASGIGAAVGGGFEEEADVGNSFKPLSGP